MADKPKYTDEQIEEWRSHSVMLNTLAWRIGQAVGSVPPEAQRTETSLAQVEQELNTLIRMASANTPATLPDLPVGTAAVSHPGPPPRPGTAHDDPEVRAQVEAARRIPVPTNTIQEPLDG